MFTKEEKYLLIEAIKHAISYRLQNETRRGDIHALVQARKKLEALEDQ